MTTRTRTRTSPWRQIKADTIARQESSGKSCVRHWLKNNCISSLDKKPVHPFVSSSSASSFHDFVPHREVWWCSNKANITRLCSVTLEAKLERQETTIGTLSNNSKTWGQEVSWRPKRSTRTPREQHSNPKITHTMWDESKMSTGNKTRKTRNQI